MKRIFSKYLYNKIRAKAQLRKLIMHKDPEVFGCIHIETHSLCNRKCRYCPVTYYPREKLEMPQEVFYKIIDQLAERNYKKMIGLYWYNEPMMDKRLPEFIRYARNKCPESHIFFASNGDLLDMDIFKKLIKAGLSRIYITQYDKEMAENLSKLLSGLDETDRKYIYITKLRYVYNRTGALKELQIQKPLKLKCKRPFFEMRIDAEGKVLLCCNDYFRKEIMGDVTKENVFDIWTKSRFKEIRAELKKGNRRKIGICSRCDFPFEKYPWLIIRRHKHKLLY